MYARIYMYAEYIISYAYIYPTHNGLNFGWHCWESVVTKKIWCSPCDAYLHTYLYSHVRTYIQASWTTYVCTYQSWASEVSGKKTWLIEESIYVVGSWFINRMYWKKSKNFPFHFLRAFNFVPFVWFLIGSFFSSFH